MLALNRLTELATSDERLSLLWSGDDDAPTQESTIEGGGYANQWELYAAVEQAGLRIVGPLRDRRGHDLHSYQAHNYQRTRRSGPTQSFGFIDDHDIDHDDVGLLD